ncbi:hypothetical protein D3C80_1505370 [compost metagenome]
MINGSRLKNSVVRLGPRRCTACIHSSGAIIEASTQAYSTRPMLWLCRPVFSDSRYSGSSTTIATSTCKYSNCSGGRRNCHFFSRKLYSA